MDAEGAKESETSRIEENLGASATRFVKNVMKSNKVFMKIPGPAGQKNSNKRLYISYQNSRRAALRGRNPNKK